MPQDKRDITMKMALERDVRLVRCEDGQLEIALEASAPKTLVHDLQRKLTAWTGKRWIVVVSKEQGAPTMRAQMDARQAEIERGVQSDPLVQAVLNRFPGAKVVGVTQNAPEAARSRAARRRTPVPDGFKSLRNKPMADFMGLMKQAAQLQSKMQALQAELDTIEVEGTAGGGMVSVRLSAKGDLKGVKIDESLYKPSEKEILEDLLVAAHADARRKAEAVMQDKMKGLTGGLPLPPGMNLT